MVVARSGGGGSYGVVHWDSFLVTQDVDRVLETLCTLYCTLNDCLDGNLGCVCVRVCVCVCVCVCVF